MNREFLVYTIENPTCLTLLLFYLHRLAGASSFNQNLCPWGPLLQATFVNDMVNATESMAETRNMFVATTCPYLLEPNLTSIVTVTGPWCTACTV